jgi:hypothetical protein
MSDTPFWSLTVPAASLALSLARVAVLLRRREDFFAGQVDPALAVNLDDLYQDLIADVDHIFHFADPVVVQLGDMDQPFFAWENLNKSAEVGYPPHFAHVGLPYFHFLH